jgi:phage-related protein
MAREIVFYETESGNCPVDDFLNGLNDKHRAKAIRNLELLQEFGHLLGGGFVDHVQDGIYELRVSFGGNISRVLYFVPAGDLIVLLHGFVKKTNKIPPAEIKTALTRRSDYRGRCMKNEDTHGIR